MRLIIYFFNNGPVGGVDIVDNIKPCIMKLSQLGVRFLSYLLIHLVTCIGRLCLQSKKFNNETHRRSMTCSALSILLAQKITT